jgi:hypothetical protein
MAAHEGNHSYFTFSHSVRRDYRYVYDERMENFLEQIRQSCMTRRYLLGKGSTVWRAQRGCEWRDITQGTGAEWVREILTQPVPYKWERMLPRKDRTSEGRVNPKGIPCLYVASDRDTAMSEVRPSKHEIVTLASLDIVRDLSLVDCGATSTEVDQLLISSHPTDTDSIWHHINEAFSRPVTTVSDDGVADYAPTQILAEVFRHESFDGIRYHSGLGTGQNIALFDVGSAAITGCSVFEVQSVTYSFKAPYLYDFKRK